MRILIIHNSYQQRGGEDVVVERESALLRSFGHEVVEYRRTNREFAEHRLGGLAAAGRGLWSNTSYREVVELIEASRPDVAHVHNTFVLISPSVYYACRRLGIPVVQTLHNYRLICARADLFRENAICEQCVGRSIPWPAVWNRCYHSSAAQTAAAAAIYHGHRLMGTWLKLVDVYVTPSEFTKQKLCSQVLPRERVVVKPNFVFPDPGPRSSRGSYAIFVGRLSPEKRIVTLLKAWREFKHFPIKVLGTGNFEKQLHVAAVESGLDNVEFCGHRSPSEVFAALKEAAFLVFPSEWYETFGLGMVEAYACGVPVIASRLGAMAEIVRDGESGLLFAPGDSNDLAAKINWAIAHPDAMVEMGKTARRLFEAHYTAEKNHELLMMIYRRAIESRSRAAGTRALSQSAGEALESSAANAIGEPT
jgi:glycosyltransferase involved in cell wall biosynthesis